MGKASNNPFRQFAAGSSSSSNAGALAVPQVGSGGWLDVKRRGRDDDRIERDRRLALEARRKRRAPASSSSTKKPVAKKRPAKKRRRANGWDESSEEEEDGGSLDGFIVDDDEEEEEEEESGGSSSEEEETFATTSDRRSVRPAQFGRASSSSRRSRGCRRSSSADRLGRVPRKRTPKGEPIEIADDDDEDEEEEELIFDSPERKDKEKTKKRTSAPSFSEEKKDGSFDFDSPNFSSSSSNDDNEPKIVKARRRPVVSSPYFSSSEKPQTKSRVVTDNALVDDDTSDEDTRIALRLSLESEPSSTFGPRRGRRSGAAHPSRSSATMRDDDCVEDSDEEAALAHALEISAREAEAEEATAKGKKVQKRLGASKKRQEERRKKNDGESNRTKMSKTKKSGKNKRSKRVVDASSSEEEPAALLESSDEDDEDNEEEDEFVEEAEREAGSVLKAANELSAKVKRAVTSWCGNSDDGDDVARGIVADGALAVSAIAATISETIDTAEEEEDEGGGDARTSSAPPKKEEDGWISQTEMRRICPKLKLADYQLVGVNWLALLDGMTCDVSGGSNNEKTRKDDGKRGGESNVNGVLADEMGLGKTVQTIAFLAWLRHRNGGAATSDDGANRDERLIVLDDDDNVVVDADDDREEEEELDDDDADAAEVRDRRHGGGARDDTGGRRRDHRPHIVVVPASVLSNWEREFRTFCPDMTVVKYHGTMAERRELRERLRRSLPSSSDPANRRRSRRPPLDVVLTTFSYFSSEKPDDRNFLRKFRFDYMVVDEAHCLKNPKGMRYRNMDKFKTSHRLLLTGTPVQNSPKELMSLLCFLMPLFSRKSSSDAFDDESAGNDGGERMLEHFVALEGGDDGGRQRAGGRGGVGGGRGGSGDDAYRKLKQLLAPFVLRRRKSEVLRQLMPPKTRRVEFVPFDDATRNVYDSILSSHLAARRSDPSSSATAAAVDDDKESAAAQRNLFTSLRKAANHPLLLRTRHTSEESVDRLARTLMSCGYFGRDATCTLKLVKKELEEFSDFDVHFAAIDLIEEDPRRRDALSRYALREDDLFRSPKFVRLRALLPELRAGGHRTLVFSQWTRCLDLLGCLMDSMGFRYLRLDGSTAISNRQALIDQFNDDPAIPVFLLSTRAGGMGINLTAADTCILHDLDFNPFNDIQAEDRCHRIGQKKPVTIIKMVTENTVDADIYAMQERKAKMNAAIFENEREDESSSSSSSSVPEAATASRTKGKRGGVAAKNKKKEEEEEERREVSSMVRNAMERFLSVSPASKKSFSGGGRDEDDGTFV